MEGESIHRDWPYIGMGPELHCGCSSAGDEHDPWPAFRSIEEWTEALTLNSKLRIEWCEHPWPHQSPRLDSELLEVCCQNSVQAVELLLLPSESDPKCVEEIPHLQIPDFPSVSKRLHLLLHASLWTQDTAARRKEGWPMAWSGGEGYPEHCIPRSKAQWGRWEEGSRSKARTWSDQETHPNTQGRSQRRLGVLILKIIIHSCVVSSVFMHSSAEVVPIQVLRLILSSASFLQVFPSSIATWNCILWTLTSLKLLELNVQTSFYLSI